MINLLYSICKKTSHDSHRHEEQVVALELAGWHQKPIWENLHHQQIPEVLDDTVIQHYWWSDQLGQFLQLCD